MPKMSRYCKAYLVGKLRAFSDWSEKSENVKKIIETVDGQDIEHPRVLTDEDYLYLQENLTVTDGIFVDENVIYDNVTTEWRQFCEQTLKFRVPFDQVNKSAAVSKPEAEARA